MTENFDEFEKRIIQVLDGFLIEAEANNYVGNRTWTNRLKEIIGDLGLQLNYDVAIGGFRNKFEKEWLYDIVWYQEDSEKRLVRIPLIVECEWDRSYSGIKYDFEKLLVGNAERRLMICQSNPGEVENLFLRFQEAINIFEENYNDRFLIAILDSDSESFYYYKTFTKN
ncbi:hypothetical protein [Mucilaginibacter sp.]|uniref:hypothetical protein n=1 Tax=Mucilaginibacter sp. TaxID=1882438 RepID=UPI0028478B58|nr:hypothetical protein [Mucilaginibacter sp.]MDR3697913.1 hypothetical protein [Mucilaginibacter sp.]